MTESGVRNQIPNPITPRKVAYQYIRDVRAASSLRQSSLYRFLDKYLVDGSAVAESSSAHLALDDFNLSVGSRTLLGRWLVRKARFIAETPREWPFQFAAGHILRTSSKVSCGSCTADHLRLGAKHSICDLHRTAPGQFRSVDGSAEIVDALPPRRARSGLFEEQAQHVHKRLQELGLCLDNPFSDCNGVSCFSILLRMTG